MSGKFLDVKVRADIDTFAEADAIKTTLANYAVNNKGKIINDDIASSGLGYRYTCYMAFRYKAADGEDPEVNKLQDVEAIEADLIANSGSLTNKPFKLSIHKRWFHFYNGGTE
jgi:hypothetical protein